MKKLLLSFLLFATVLYPATMYAQLTARGTVYLDKNENGTLDSGEEGIPEVAVSNGREVVLTDDHGKYSLKIDETNARIFVIKPTGYDLPVDALNQPQFYYLHKPEGSPDLKFPGVQPTGPLPERINFPLYKTTQSDSFNVLVFGDSQPYTRQEVKYFDRDIVSELQDAEGYAFGITLGDIVGNDLELFQPYSQSVAKIGIPWFNVQGNHDMNFDAQSNPFADETFEATFGPPTYSFNVGKAHFIILDDVIYPRPTGESGYVGGLTDRQLDFIENDLKHVPSDHLVVLAFHIPMFTPEGRETFRYADRARLFELLKSYPHTLSLSAHTHYQRFYFFDEDEDWERLKPHTHYNVGTTSCDWWSGVPDERGIPPTLMRDGTPNGYATLKIDGNDYTINYKAANYPKEYRMSIWGPEVVPQDSLHGAQLYVNYFLGNRHTKVEYRLKGSDHWRSMHKVLEQDPYVVALREKWDNREQQLEGKRPSNPVESHHLWKTGMPTDLPLGKQTIEIRVTDVFGRTFTDEFIYEVVEPKP